MPRAIKCNACPCFSLPSLCRMRQYLGEQERRLIEVKGLVRDRAYRLGKQRALGVYRSELVSIEQRLHLFHGHHAMMFAMHPAAGREPRLGSASKRKQRRDLRKAEQQQQRDGYRASHGRGFANNSTTALTRLVIANSDHCARVLITSPFGACVPGSERRIYSCARGVA